VSCQICIFSLDRNRNPCFNGTILVVPRTTVPPVDWLEWHSHLPVTLRCAVGAYKPRGRDGRVKRIKATPVIYARRQAGLYVLAYRKLRWNPLSTPSQIGRGPSLKRWLYAQIPKELYPHRIRGRTFT